MNYELMNDFQCLFCAMTILLHVFLSESTCDSFLFLVVHGQYFLDDLFLTVAAAFHIQSFADVKVHTPNCLVAIVVVGVAEHRFSGDGIVEENAGVVGNQQFGDEDEVVEVGIRRGVNDKTIGW